MKLYSKKLTGIEALEREKQLLQYAKTNAESDKLFSIEALLGSKTKDKKKEEKEGVAGSLNLQSLAMDLLMGFGKRKLKNAGKSAAIGTARAGKSAVKTFAKEFVLGYLKWKAIELSYRQIAKFIENRKKKKVEID